MTNLKTRGWVLNALVAAIYIVLSIGPASLNLASGAIQFRLSESLNHLVVFDRKYIVGVVTGVVDGAFKFRHNVFTNLCFVDAFRVHYHDDFCADHVRT